MQTVYDWISLITFCGLVVLFLQRSTSDTITDSIWHYLPPALGCAAANWLGNHDYEYPAIFVLGLSLVYIVYVLKPFPSRR